MKTKNILVVNDDGILSPGLHALAKGMRQLGNVWVVAPERLQNAMGRALTLHKPLRLTRIKKQVFAVNGTPADCVTLGIGQLLKENPPILIVSGINKGLNLGDDITNSGTVSAAMEGVLRGITSIAVSLDGQRSFKFHVAEVVAHQIADKVLRLGLPPETLLNVNVPKCSLKDLRGVKITSLSRKHYKDPVVEKTDPRGGKYYWIAGEQISWERAKGADIEAISNNMVSITPLHIDLTQYQVIKTLRVWERSLSSTIKRSRDKK